MSRRTNRSARRAPVLLALAGVLVIGGLADRAGSARRAAAVTADSVQPVPVAAPAGAYSSSWFCAGGTGPAGGSPGYLFIANSGAAPVSAVVTVIPSAGNPATLPVTVAAHSTGVVPEAVASNVRWVGAIVDVDGGGVAVDQAVSGPLGAAVSPCAVSGSQHWYFPTGQTRVNADETLLMLNPYPTDSIVDLSFSTDQGTEAPEEFDGLDVPPRGLIAVDLGSHLRRRAAIAATVSTRTGNVVAWEVETTRPPAKGATIVGTPAASNPLSDPAAPDPGVALTLGAPSAATSWVWPDGLAGGGIDEQYVIYNPGPATAAVRLSLGLQRGTAEPFDLTVGPYQAVPIVSEQQARIPAGLPHTATLVSTNGVPVVATRSVAAHQATLGGVTYTGSGQMLGERLSAPGWLVIPAGAANHVAQVVVDDPGTRPAQVQLAGLAAGAETVSVPAGGRSALSIPAGTSAPLVVTSPVPVYVEYDVYTSGKNPAYSISAAVPLS